MQLQLNLGNCGGGSLCTCGGWRKCGDLVVWVTVMQHTAVAAVQPIEGSRQAEATQQQRMRQLTRRRQNRIGLGPRSWSGPDDDDDDDHDDDSRAADRQLSRLRQIFRAEGTGVNFAEQ